MTLLGKLLIIVVSMITVVVIKRYQEFAGPLPKPYLASDKYWGPGRPPAKLDTSVRPFKIDYDASTIAALRDQLSDLSKIRAPLESVKYEYGMNTDYLKTVINYWRDEYLTKWSERQAHLNKYPQFKTQIQGLDIHFIHVKAKEDANRKQYPLLLLHGWPGSVVEFYEFIEKLQQVKGYAFDIVVPSLVGYGFSDAAAKVGMGPAEMSVVFRNLMNRLGYKKFIVQGGDWGSMIGSNLATLFPENVIGYHSNMCNAMTPLGNIKQTIASLYPKMFMDEEHVEFIFPFFPKMKTLIVESGYMHLQATKPDTIGVALSNNPIGLAAYILEKFSTWTDPNLRSLVDGGFSKYYTLDQLIDNLMFYYLPNAILTSQRLYSEALDTHTFAYQLDRVPVTVPVGCARFKYDLMHAMDWVLKDKYPNLVHSTHHQDGGHFIAFQLPDVLLKDFMQFVKKL